VDILDAARAVAAAARQHDGDRTFAGVLSQRSEEMIDRKRQPVPRIAIAQQQLAPLDDHFLHRGQQVDGVGLHHHFVLSMLDRDGRPAAEELVHQALEIRRQVLQNDEGHPGVGRQPCEQPLERLEPARRGADADDVKVRFGARPFHHDRGTSAQSLPDPTRGTSRFLRKTVIHGVVAELFRYPPRTAGQTLIVIS